MEKSQIDKAVEVRKGEELNLENLQKYLQEHLNRTEGPLIVKQFPGGYSNLTYLIELGDAQYVLRRAPIGANIKSAHDMSREFKILSKLVPSYAKIPKPILYTDDEHIIGAPFYIMEKVNGVILRKAHNNGSIPDEKTMKGIAKSLLETFVELHAVDLKETGLEDFHRPGNYVERQITGWTKRYYKAKTDENPELEKVAKWLEENQPVHSEIAFIHNDFKYDNVVLDAEDLTKVIAVLDWEMSTVGDPLMDLGTSIGYWVNPEDPDFIKQLFQSPTMIAGNPSRGEFVHQYAIKSGRDVNHIVFYYVYGLFKISSILQQIYFRYKKGLTRDKRFSNLNMAVSAFGKMALRAIEKDKIDDLF